MLNWMKKLRQKSGSEITGEITQVIPFFAFLTLVLLGLSGWTLVTSEALRSNIPLAIAFTVLVLAHVALHWASPWVILPGMRTTGTYLAIQGALAFVIAVLASNSWLMFALFLALIGEAVSILRPVRLAVVAVIVYLSLSALTAFVVPGTTSLVEWMVGVIPTTIFVVVYVLLYTRQAEANVRAQRLLAELEAANRQLSEYAAQIEDLTLANERQRMARELHDTLAQGLAGLILQLEAVDSHLTNGRTDRAGEIVDQAMERARETLKDARRAIDDLRSGGEPSDELAEPIRAEVERFCSTSGIQCDLELDLPDGISESLRDHVLKAVREGLTNVARHAQASRVQVRLDVQGSELQMEISDDGLGFDPGIVGQPGHYGLVGMRERARLAGGRLDIVSQPGTGTCLRMIIPLEVQP